MNLQELRDRLIKINRCADGEYVYIFRYYNKRIYYYDTDSAKYDAITSRKRTCVVTEKQALLSLYRFAVSNSK